MANRNNKIDTLLKVEAELMAVERLLLRPPVMEDMRNRERLLRQAREKMIEELGQ